MAALNIDLQYKRYPSYKKSDVKWIGELPSEWKVKRLKFVVDILKRIVGHEGPDVLSITQQGIKVKDITSGEGQLAMDYSKYQIIKRGEFAMNHMDLLTGYVDISKFDGVISPDYRVFNIKNTQINPEFLLILFQKGYNDKIFYAYGQGVSQLGRWRFPADNFNNFRIPIPQVEEQTAITNFLREKNTKIDKAIAQKEKMIELLKERKQIIIQNAVTKGLDPFAKMIDSGVEWIGEIPVHWELKRLKNVAMLNKQSLPENTSNNFDFDYVDIGSVSYANGIEKTERFNFKDSPSRARRIANPGNTVISTVRTYLKAIDFISEAKSAFIFSTGFAILQSNTINDKFLYHFVRSDAFTEQVTVNSTGMSYPAINSTDLSKLWLAVPPSQEQRQIVSYIEAQSTRIDKAICLQQTQIEKLKEYKATLIDSAVTGKIKVC